MLELVIIVGSLEGIQIDGGGRRDNHIKPIRAEIAVPGVLHNLRKYHFFKPDRPINHNSLSHQHHQLAVGTGGQVVHVGLSV